MEELGTAICFSQVGLRGWLVDAGRFRIEGLLVGEGKVTHQYCRKVMSLSSASISSAEGVVSTSVIRFLPNEESLGLLGPLASVGR